MASVKPKRTMFSRTSFYINAKVLIANASATHSGHFDSRMYVEKLVPAKTKKGEPIILVHGDHHTGQIWTTKPDGQPGWADDFVAQGLTVYIVDLPCTGRSACSTDIHGPLELLGTRPSRKLVQDMWTAPGKTSEDGPWPGAKDHDEWPGTGCSGDRIFEQYYAALQPAHHSTEHRQMLCQVALVALLKKTGSAKLLGQNTGANMAMLAADKVPELVSSIVSIEPSGPPFGHGYEIAADGSRVYGYRTRYDPNTRPYGLSDLPLEFDPPSSMPTIGFEHPLPLDLLQQDLGGGQSRLMQWSENGAFGSGEPGVRILKNLSMVHHLVVTSPTSSHFATDASVVEFMRQAGCNVIWWKLANKGITGNGHLMFLERNSADIADMVVDWWKDLPDLKPSTTLKRGNKGPKVRINFNKSNNSDPDPAEKSKTAPDNDDDDNEPVQRKRHAARGKKRTEVIDLCSPVVQNAILPLAKPQTVQPPRKKVKKNVRFADKEAEITQAIAIHPEHAALLALREATAPKPQESSVNWATDYGSSPLCTEHDMSLDMTSLVNNFPSFPDTNVQPQQPAAVYDFDMDQFVSWPDHEVPANNSVYVNPQDLMSGPGPVVALQTDYCGQVGNTMSPMPNFATLQLPTVM